MSQNIARREWLKRSSLAALGLGFSMQSIAGEDYLPRNWGSEKGILNLGSNENPYGLSPLARQAIVDMIGYGNRYPFNVARLQSFKKDLGSFYGLKEDHLLITAGSGEALTMLARHFNKGNIVTANPTFGILPNTARKIGTEVIEIPLNYDKVHDLPAMLSAINDKTQLVYLVNPANPTGTVLKPSVIKSFCEEASKKTVVVVDEAYIDFLDAPDNESMVQLIEYNPRIIIVRTFSKIFGMAGMRVGFIMAHPDMISQLGPNFFASSQLAVSTIGQAAAMECLKDLSHCKMSKQKNAEARNYAMAELKKMNLRAIPSYTNFIFFSLGNYPGDFAQDMMKKNVALRSNTYPDGKWCRLSIGTLDEMQQFFKVMKPSFNGLNSG